MITRQHDAATERMLASFAKQRAQRKTQQEANDAFIDRQTQAEVDAEELALFDRAEARAINNGFN